MPENAGCKQTRSLSNSWRTSVKHTRMLHTHDKQASLKDPAHCSLGDLISCPVLLRPTQQLTSHPVLPEIATAAGGHDCQDGCVIRPSLVPALLLPISLSLSPVPSFFLSLTHSLSRSFSLTHTYRCIGYTLDTSIEILPFSPQKANC